MSRAGWMLEELNMCRCTRCGYWRHAELFRDDKRNNSGKSSWCRDCHNAKDREPSPCGTPGWTRSRARKLAQRYKMSPEDWESLFLSQGSCCYLCSSTNPESKWVVDHNHDCCPGAVTCGHCVLGIACDDCNTLEASIQRLISRGGDHALQRVVQRAKGNAPERVILASWGCEPVRVDVEFSL